MCTVHVVLVKTETCSLCATDGGVVVESAAVTANHPALFLGLLVLLFKTIISLKAAAANAYVLQNNANDITVRAV